MKLIKKITNILLIFSMLFGEFVPYMVSAKELEKGDIRLNEIVSDTDSVTVTEGSFTNPGDVEVEKIVSKTSTEGKYKIEFRVRGKTTSTTTVTTKPVYAVVIFDESGSMCEVGYRYCTNMNKWNNAVSGAKNFAKTLLAKIPTANIALVTFDVTAEIRRNFATTNLDSANFGSPEGGTNLHDGLIKAENLLDSIQEDAYKYVVIISDGEPTYYVRNNGSVGGDGSSTSQNVYNATVNKANDLKKKSEIFGIGYSLPSGIVYNYLTAEDILKSLTTSDTNEIVHYYDSDPTAIANAFNNIASSITTSHLAGTNATLKDNLGGAFTLTSGNTTLSLDEITSEWTSMGSFEISINQDSTTGWHKTNNGFTLSYTDSKGVIKNISCSVDPEVYWIQNQYGYRIEYYYDNVIDNALTVTSSAIKDTMINVTDDMIIANTKEGYDYTTTNPTTKQINISNNVTNVIKVYYEKRTLNYKVEHYLEDNNGNFSILKDTDNLTTKYGQNATYEVNNYEGYGYNASLTTPSNLIVKDNSLVIKLYYQKSNYNYTVNYHYEDITNVVTETNQAKFGLQINVTNEMINNHNITGYKYDHSTPSNNTITVGIDNSQNVIDVYYVKDDFGYSIEYYYDGIRNDSKTDTYTGTYLNKITSYTDKNITGYKFDKVENNPLEITEVSSNNVMKVYYVKDDFGYSIEYYYDGIRNDSKTDTYTGTYLNKITSYTDKNITGYKLNKVENNPLTITEVSSDNVMKVYYVKDKFNYVVKHYLEQLDGSYILNDTDYYNSITYKSEAVYNTNNYLGYTYNADKTIGKNATVPANNDLVIKLYYDLNMCAYRVEYYYDNNIDDSKTANATVKFGTVINAYDNKNITGYYFVKDENKPLTVGNDSKKNVIKVYYEKNDFSYIIEYYYDGIRNDSKTDTYTGTYLDKITGYTDKNITGYKLNKVENNPLTITEVSSDNVMKVYYVKDQFGYSIEYYYDGIRNDSKTDTYTGTYLNKITSYTDKNITGYKLNKVENNPLTITEVSSDNVMKVYYVKDEFNYTINYHYEDITDVVSEKQRAEFDAIITVTDDMINNHNITGYKYDHSTPSNNTITITTIGNVIDVYYVKDKFNYTVEHYLEQLDGTYTNSAIDYYTNAAYKSEAKYEPKVYTSYTYTKNAYTIKNEVVMDTTVPANNDLVIKLYYDLNNANIIVHYVIRDVDTGKYIPFVTAGQDLEGVVGENFNGLDLNDLIINDKVTKEYDLLGRKPLDYNFIGIYNGSYLDEMELINDKIEDYHVAVTDEDQEYTYVYEPPYGGPPQTGVEYIIPSYVDFAIIGLFIVISYYMKKEEVL